jgi:hypothetical protein
MISTVKVNGKTWKLFSPIPSRYKVNIEAAIRHLDKTNPTVRMFGGVVYLPGQLGAVQFAPK